MKIRAFLLTLLILVGIIMPPVAATCCGQAESCCADERPTCPLLPDGTCVLSALHQPAAVATPRLDLPPTLLAPCAVVDGVRPEILEAPRPPLTPHCPPHLQLAVSLRL